MPNYVTPTVGQASVGDSSNTDRLVPELWAKEIADNRVDNLVLWALIDSRYSSEISQKGDTLHVPFLSEIADSTEANASVTSASTIDALDATLIDLFIDRYIRKALGIQDVAKAQAAYELRAPYVTRLGRFLDRAKDEEVWRKAVAGFTKVIPATGNTNTTLGFADVVAAAAYLDAQNVPEDNRVIVVNGYGRADLRQVPEFTSYKETGDSGLVSSKTGFVGHIYGMPVYVTNAVAEATGAYQFLMFHKEAIIGATQTVPSLESDRNKLLGVDYIVGSELFGVKVLRPDHGVVITRPVTSA